MIKIVNLNKKYDDKVILKDINFTFNDFGLYIITGDNGCGKTTLLYIIGLLDDNYEGDYFFNKQNINDFSAKQREKIKRENFSLLFSKGNLIPFLNVEDNIFFGIKRPKYYEVKYVNVDLKRKASLLSGGEEVLVALQREKMLNKKVLLLDEVTAALDDDNLRKTMEILIEQSKEKLIILVSHDVRTYGYGTLLRLENGKLFYM